MLYKMPETYPEDKVILYEHINIYYTLSPPCQAYSSCVIFQLTH